MSQPRLIKDVPVTVAHYMDRYFCCPRSAVDVRNADRARLAEMGVFLHNRTIRLSHWMLLNSEPPDRLGKYVQ